MDPQLATLIATLQQANQESLNSALGQIAAQTNQMLGEIVKVNKTMVDQMTGRPKSSSMVDTRGIGKPSSFKGDDSKFVEWIAKLNAFLRAGNTRSMTWLKKVCAEDRKVTEEVVNEIAEDDVEVATDIDEFSIKLYSILVSCTEDDPFRIVNSVANEEGLEAYSLIMKRYEPRTAGTKRAVLKSIVNNPQCKKVADM